MRAEKDNLALRVAAFEPRSLANGPGVRAVLWVQGCGRRCPGCFNAEFLPREGGRLVSVAEVVGWIEAAAERDAGGGWEVEGGGRAAPGADAPASRRPGTGPEGRKVEGGGPRPVEGGRWKVDAGSRMPDPGCLAPLGIRHSSFDIQHSALASAPGSSTAIEGVTFSGGEPFDQAVAVAAVARAAQGLGLGVLVFTGYSSGELRARGEAGWSELLAATDLLVAGPYEQDRPRTHPLLASANQDLVHLTERYRSAVGPAGGRRTEFHIAADGTVRVTGFPGRNIATRGVKW